MLNETKIREYLEKENLDAFFMAKRENIRFTSGWTGDDSYLLLTKEGQYFFTDPRYTEQADIEIPDYDIINWRFPGKTVGDSVAKVVAENNIKTIAFEDDYLTFDMYADFNAKVKAELVQAGGVIDRMRVIKSPKEIEYSRIACEIACRAYRRLLPEIKVGVTEKELAMKLSLYMTEEGADNQPYGNILISGAKTSLLHGIPTSKAIEYGDLVLMDFGCQYNGYMSDMTRTVVVGKATDKQKEVYKYTKLSLEAAMDCIKAGTNYKDVYPESIKPLEGTEYGPLTYNKIGHSIGLFVHEQPYLAVDYDDLIDENTVLTVEPGIYIPGWGGIRLEDQILVTKDGYEDMVDLPLELTEL